MALEVGTSALSCVVCSILNGDCHFSKGVGISHTHRERGKSIISKSKSINLEIS